MRAVVTGGAGFIGSHLMEALVGRGDDVVCLERAGASRRWIDGLSVTLRETGIHDVPGLTDSFDGADVVYHLAGLLEARSPADFYRVNTLGTECVLKAAAQLGSRAPHVVLMSSIAALGPCRNGEPLSPDTAPFPLSHYGHSKLLAECLVHAYDNRVPSTIVRLPSVYGPREQAVLTLFRMIRRGIALTIGSWERTFSLIYVRDLVAALIAVGANRAAVNRTYCVAYPESVTWRAFAEAVGEALGRRPMLVSVPEPVARLIAVGSELVGAVQGRTSTINRSRVREMTQRSWVCDPSRALAELPFSPVFPMARGVAETAAWYRDARWL